MNARFVGAAVGAALAATLLVVVAAEAAPTRTARLTYELEPAGSSLKFTAIQQGAKFESRFETFTARVQFDPAQPETGRITARIDLGSVDTGNPERDEVLKTADWFSLSQWPEASFTAERIVRAADGYAASGTLTLRGVTRPVTLSSAGRRRRAASRPGWWGRPHSSGWLSAWARATGRTRPTWATAWTVQVDIRLRPSSSH